MPHAALSDVRHRVRIGEPLPFAVRDANLTLLLARGQVVQTPAQLAGLLRRGALVDVAELQSTTERLWQLPRAQLAQRWQDCTTRVSQALLHAPHGGSFSAALDAAATPVLALIARDPDLAIFQVLRGGAGDDTAYGARRSLNSAIAAFLVAQRLGWDPAAVERVFKVALTMNVAMLELQGQLAQQRHAPTPAQRVALQSHPERGCALLQRAGINDRDWLDAVLQHHEREDGSGYPGGCRDVGELASLARRADSYTAKLASRSHRDAMQADLAGRQMFMQDPGSPMTAALAKEFGLYPPGCCVRLESGAVGVVVARGPTLTTPLVALLDGPEGPRHVDSGMAGQRIVGVVGERAVDVRVTAEKLLAALR